MRSNPMLEEAYLGLKAGAPLDLAAKASWLVCADVCIPESADLELNVPVKAQAGIEF